jgi:hypothetical protein
MTRRKRKKLLALLLLFFGGSAIAGAAGLGLAGPVANIVADFVSAATIGLGAFLIFRTLEAGLSGARILAAILETLVVVFIVKYATTIVAAL